MLGLGVEVEMSNFPLVRISSKKHIEELRSGQLFLRNNSYYQRMEENDNARSDILDGSISFPDDGILSSLTKGEVTNGRIMKLTSYVACFYHFHCEKNGYFYVPEEDKHAIREFNRDSALIINTDEFESRVRNACKKEGLPLLMRDVLYISSKQENEISKHIRTGNVPWFIHTPQFVKSNKFYNQHEYRVSVDYTPNFLVSQINEQILSMNNEEVEELRNSSKTVYIGSVDDISEMVTVDELLNSYFREEGN